MNLVIIVGKIVNELEIKKKNDKKMLVINIAVPRCYKNSNGIYETDIIPCILWDSIAEKTAEYCKQNDTVGIKGRIEVYNNIIIIAEKVSFLTSKDAK